ncbi:MAG: pentapeptide repeat-containing protein, partial [Clostridiales bacterium]
MIETAIADETAIKNNSFENEVLIGTNISRIEFETVQFIKCKFQNCDFSKSSFYTANFSNCDFANCIFKDTYWKKSRIVDCKGDGSNFSNSHLKESILSGSSFCYANCFHTVWEN